MPRAAGTFAASGAAAAGRPGGGKFMGDSAEAGFSGRSDAPPSFSAMDLRFALHPPPQQHRLLRVLRSSSHTSSSSASSSSKQQQRQHALPLHHLLQRSAMAFINVQAAAITPKPPNASSTSPEHSNAQLWLQDKLSRIPFFRPLHAHLAGGTAGLELAAARTRNPNKEMMSLQPPKGLSAVDQSLWEMFVEMDVNGDGVIDEEELLSALIKLRLPCSPSYVDQMMTQFHDSCAARPDDSRESRSKILWEEFKHYVNKRDKQIEAAFREFDRDGNGVITAFEVGQALVKAGLPTTGRDIRKVMEVLGKDDSDAISYQDFRKFACFMPSLHVKNIDIPSYLGWMWSAPVVAAATQRRKPNIITDPAQHFMAFDLVVRTCMVGSLALMVVMSLKLD